MDTQGGLAGDWAMIEAQLPTGWRELAVKHRVIKPVLPQLKAKITDPAVLLRLIFHHVALGVSLKITCAMAAAAALIDISSVALHLRVDGQPFPLFFDHGGRDPLDVFER